MVCKISLWLYVNGQKMKLPHEGEFICKVILDERNTLENGAADYLFVDCTRSIAWLKSDHPNKFWIPQEECHE